LAAVASGLIGAGALAAILFATGAVDHGTSVVKPLVINSRGAAGSPLDAPALYVATAPGVVDITAQTTSEVQNLVNPSDPSRERTTATGTGIVLDGRGNILTADHVVRRASSVTVTFSNGTTRTARILGQDASTDVAVLHIDPAGLTLHPLALGNASALQVGDPVAAIGDPFDYQRSMSTGIVSGLDRTIQGLNGFSVGHAIQTDAAIDPGNSGGPLVNARGQVIGIVDQIATGNSGAETSTGVGFAVSIDVAKAELAALEHGLRVSHAYLGVATAPAVGTSSGNGVLVEAVATGGPAAKAGVRSGDVIESVGGKQLRGVNGLISTLASARPGQRVTLGILRGSRHLTLHVTLAGQPSNASAG
jgi:putative serine protease PepD